MWSPLETFEYGTNVKDFNVKTMEARNLSFQLYRHNLEHSDLQKLKQWCVIYSFAKKYRDFFRFVSIR
jgi:hypothetical protein